jgi:hypothetical protein
MPTNVLTREITGLSHGSKTVILDMLSRDLTLMLIKNFSLDLTLTWFLLKPRVILAMLWTWSCGAALVLRGVSVVHVNTKILSASLKISPVLMSFQHKMP